MQVTNKKELKKRVRYYQDLIDLNIIEKGETYTKLKESYIIFICTFDAFNKGLPKYTFENICNEDNSIKLGDETYKIFFNTLAFEKIENDKLKAFLKYVNGEREDNTFINKINDKVRRIKRNEEWRQEYMTLLMREQEIAEENYKKGIEEGIKEGIKEGMIIKQIEMLKRFKKDEEEIIREIEKEYNLSIEEVKRYL